MMVSQAAASRQETDHPKPPLGKVLFVSGSAAMSGLLFGYDTAVINGAVPGIQEHLHLSDSMVGAIVSVALLGCVVGALSAGRFAEQFGRRPVMRAAAVLFFCSSIGSMFSPMPEVLAFWRLVGGGAIGVASVIGPLYIAEVAPPAYRGRLSSLQQLAVVSGIAISQWVNYLIAGAGRGTDRSLALGAASWQWMLGLCAVPALVYFLLASAIPESPRFLVANGQEDQARVVFAALEGPDADADARVAEVRASIAADRRPKLADLYDAKRLLRPVVWVGIGLAVLQQLVGINVVFYYSAVLWQSVGVGESDSLLRSFSTAVVNIVGTLIAMSLIDRVGRKALLLVGSAGMTVALFGEAWAFGQVDGQDAAAFAHPEAGLVALVSAHLFVFFFAISWGAVLWVILGEMFPAKLRAAAISLATACNWIANWAVTVSFPGLAAWNLAFTYVGYAVFAAISFFFVKFLVRETKGKTLEAAGA